MKLLITLLMAAIIIPTIVSADKAGVTLRSLTNNTIAYSVWELPNGTVTTIHMTQKEYDNINNTKIYTPPTGARLLIAAGGIQAINTTDGWWREGDAWETLDDDDIKILRVATSEGIDFIYSQGIASDPGTQRKSNLTTITYESNNNLVDRYLYDTKELNLVSYTPTTAEIIKEETTSETFNHKSITFDAVTTAATSGVANSLTFSHTTTTQSNRAIVVGAVQNRATRTVSQMSYAGTVLTTIASLTGGSVNSDARYSIAPSTGANNVIVNISASTDTIVAIAITYYGVDQTNPITANATNTSTSANVSTAVTSSATDKVIDFFGDLAAVGGTVSPDAPQTYRATANFSTDRLGASDRDGAGSTTSMVWTHSAVEADHIVVSLREIAGTSLCTGTSNCVLTCPQTISSNENLGGYNVTFNGVGTATFNANFTNCQTWTFNTCSFQINQGGTIPCTK